MNNRVGVTVVCQVLTYPVVSETDMFHLQIGQPSGVCCFTRVVKRQLHFVALAVDHGRASNLGDADSNGQSEQRALMHPNLISYKETASREFPLILVVGREPNDSNFVSQKLGTYDFAQHPRCGLWNTSYKVIADLSVGYELSCASLKKLCAERQSSPIVIADALPIGLPDKARNKAGARKAIIPAAIEQHVAGVFSHRPIIERVGLALLSGHHLSGFDYASSLYQRELEKREIPFVRVNFLTMTQNRKIKEQIEASEGALDIVRRILGHFVAQKNGAP